MESVREVIHSFFVVDSIWSVVFRGAIWFVIAFFIIISMDITKPEESSRKLKANLGFFLLFLTLSTALIWMLFGYQAVPLNS